MSTTLSPDAYKEAHSHTTNELLAKLICCRAPGNTATDRGYVTLAQTHTMNELLAILICCSDPATAATTHGNSAGHAHTHV
jgi:hypothetical protein